MGAYANELEKQMAHTTTWITRALAAEARIAELEQETEYAFDRGLATAMEKTYAREIARAEAVEARNAVLVNALNEAANTLEDMSWSHNCGVLGQAAVRTRAALSANGDK